MSAPDETLDIHTPENVAFGYQVAGIGSRFLAALIDTLIIALLQVVAAITILLIANTAGGNASNGGFSAWVYAALFIVTFIFYWGYYIFFEMLWNGQSPGKRWTSLRVIRADGTPVTLTESLIRNLVRTVDLLPAAYGFGIVAMFIDKRSRRLGDLAAGTLVVHDRAPLSIQSLSVRRAANLRMQGLTTVSLQGFPVERLTDDDLNLIEDFLLRRDQMTHRELLAVQMLNTLHQRLGLPVPSASRLEAEDMLVAILQAAQKRDDQ
jgi:uncharacterized RDD family membrane protein YckC